MDVEADVNVADGVDAHSQDENKAGQQQPQQQQQQQQQQQGTGMSVAILIDELRNNDMQVRLNSFRKLSVIAQALGPQRTRDELIPYLNEFIDDDDYILLALAEELGNLIEYVGGPAHAHTLLAPLETLSGVEESVVRDMAVESINKVIKVLSNEHVIDFVVPMLRQLANGDWFTSRISATAIFSSIYMRVDNTLREELRHMFVNICQDETPMVRRAACSRIGAFAGVVEYQYVNSELLGAFSKLAHDDQDSVRLLAVDSAVAVAEVFKDADEVQKIVPLIFELCEDKSWRVRYMVADKFVEIYKIVSIEEENIPQLVDSFVSLLKDSEAEVRTVASFKVGEISKCVGSKYTLEKLLPPVSTLVKDTCQYTRAALASVIMSMTTVIPKKQVFDNLLPLFLQLLKDQHPEVRLNIISKLDTVNEVIGVDLLSQSLLPAICELSMDKKWRVRLAIIGHIPLLAKQLGHEFFETRLADLCMNWLGDEVYSIRAAATSNLTRLADVFGVDWARVHIVPKIESLGAHKSYLYRMTALFAIKDIAATLGPELTTSTLLPVVLTLADDKVPNVRFNVSKTLGTLLPHLPASAVKESAIPCLKKLQNDSDPDVAYFATKSLEE